MTPMADLDRLIQSLYTFAIDDDREGFRSRALQEVCRWLGASGGSWLTRSDGLAGEYTEYPGAAVALNKMMALNFSDGVREYHLNPLPPELCPGGKPGSGEQGYLVHYAHRGGDHLNSVILIRLPPGRRLQHVEDIRRAVGHMVEAGTLALRQFICRDEWLFALGRPNRGSAALVDARGTIYAASGRFREMLAAEFGERDYASLPQALPEDALAGEGLFFQGALHFRSARQGQLYLLHARKPLPLDGLSPREQQIARALGTGKTFKSVARQFGIAVSTVANHASRIYRKLGIFRREELVELVRTPGGT
jgi:DNA-binding CsgD family transcriptional regulator